MTAAAQGGTYLVNADAPTAAVRAAAAIAIASGASLLIGFFTPGATALAGVSLVVIAGSSHAIDDPALFLDWTGALSVAGVAAAILFLGPGALSLDARLFGRREIVFPQDRRPSAD